MVCFCLETLSRGSRVTGGCCKVVDDIWLGGHRGKRFQFSPSVAKWRQLPRQKEPGIFSGKGISSPYGHLTTVQMDGASPQGEAMLSNISHCRRISSPACAGRRRRRPLQIPHRCAEPPLQRGLSGGASPSPTKHLIRQLS